MALASVCRIILFNERAIDRVGTVYHVPPGEGLERLPSAFLAHCAGSLGVLEHSRDGRLELFTIAVADEHTIAAMADQRGYRAAPAPDDRLSEEPGLQIDEAERLDARRMHQKRTRPVPAPFLRFRNIRSGDDA